jgi:Fe-S cluster assembly ATP-binding protein
MLDIHKLAVQVGDTPIVKELTLQVKPGEVHAIMGPNGSGKSTLAYTLAGHPGYSVTGGQILLDEKDVLEMSPDERSQAGLFLAFQYPIEVPGVKIERFLRLAHQARFAQQPEKLFAKAIEFRRHMEKLADQLEIDRSLLGRNLNEGFSGGEKKRLEILQMAILEPRYAILDETDSGLDVDAIKAVAAGVNFIIEEQKTGVIVITHYQRILDYLKPTHVHIMKDGVIEQSGGQELIAQVETKGYR